MAGPWWNGVEFLATNGVAEGKYIVYHTREDPAAQASPTFVLDKAAAQLLMDDLWNCGLRPSEGSGSAGALAATQRHLEDMRRLVFKEPQKTTITMGTWSCPECGASGPGIGAGHKCPK